MLFHSLASLLRSFRDAGIAVMVLKGIALTLLHYKDYGIRPMNDIDILVHPEHAERAVMLLKETGWTPIDFLPTAGYISVSYSHGFRNAAGQECDLHWHLLSQGRRLTDDAPFWKDADGVEIHGAAGFALNPTDLLMHVCVHGARWNTTPPIRWVADAMTVLNNTSAVIDWDRLMLQADRLRLILPLRDTLNYLKTHFDATIDEGFLHAINTLAVPAIERIEHRVTMSPPTPWTAFLDLWCQHSRLMGQASLIRKLIRYPHFLQHIWGVAIWKLSLLGISKVMTWSQNPLAKPPE
jgi:hypothetical protein